MWDVRARFSKPAVAEVAGVRRWTRVESEEVTVKLVFRTQGLSTLGAEEMDGGGVFFELSGLPERFVTVGTRETEN